jgi:hypothetical protein
LDVVTMGLAADSVAAPGARGRARGTEPCRNCGDPSVASFCPRCGQKKVEVRVRLRDLIAEALDEQFSINGRLPRTLGTLLFKPGRLTRAYVEGRIARYVTPFRLYIVASVTFFVLLSLGRADVAALLGSLPEDAPAAATEAESVVAEPDAVAAEAAAPGVAESTDAAAAAGDGAETARRAQVVTLGDWTDNVTINTPWPRLNVLLERRLERFSRMTPEEARREVTRQIVERVPIMMFVLLPVFALMLKLFYVRRGRYYVEHFIFSLHFHAFVFSMLVVDRLLGQRLTGLMWLYVLIYLFLAMRFFYEQGVLKTATKYVVFLWSYAFVASVALAATVLLAVLLV